MAACLVKYDDGFQHFSANCFPARLKKSKSKQADTSSGAWQVAHHAEQRRQLKVLLCSKPRTFDEIRQQRLKAEKDGTAITLPVEETVEDGKILDGFFLMKHCCVEDPSDLCSVNVSGQSLTESAPADFELFENVIVVNASDNLLTFGEKVAAHEVAHRSYGKVALMSPEFCEQSFSAHRYTSEIFSSFRLIEELQLAVNGLRGISVDKGQFPYLKKLDLSFNNLSPTDIRELGNLPQLLELDITGNNLYSLPPDLARSITSDFEADVTAQDHRRVDRDADEGPLRFPCLEKLIADDNNLSTDAAFLALAGLQNLVHLSLQKNDIQRIPHLLAVDDRYIVHDELPGRRPMSARRSARLSARLSARRPASRSSSVLTTQMSPEDGQQRRSSAAAVVVDGNVNEAVSTVMEDFENAVDNSAFAELNDDLADDGTNSQQCVQQMPTLAPPFANLRHLNLACNKISLEESVLAVSAWPKFNELVLYDNPLTVTNRSGNLRIAKKFLQDKLGIKVHHSRQLLQPAKPHVEMTNKPSRKVSSKVPTVPRCNVDQLLLAIEAAGNTRTDQQPRSRSACELPTAIRKSPLPAITSAREWSVNVNQGSDVVDQQPTIYSVTMSDVENSRDPLPPRAAAKTDAEPFFMTETDETGEKIRIELDEDDSDDDEQSEMKTDQNADASSLAVKPLVDIREFEGYEVLFDVDESVPDDALPNPQDVVGNVRALNYALRHPLVFRDKEVRLDNKQKAYKAPSRKAESHVDVSKTKADKVNGVLENLKTRETYTEAPLTDVLANRKQGKEYLEAKRLLAEVQERYSSAQNETVNAANRMSNALLKPRAGDRTRFVGLSKPSG